MDLTDTILTDIGTCADFTRRNAPVTGEQLLLIANVMRWVDAEKAKRAAIAEAVKTVEAKPEGIGAP